MPQKCPSGRRPTPLASRHSRHDKCVEPRSRRVDKNRTDSAMTLRSIEPGLVLTGPLFSEAVRVVTVQPAGAGAWTVGVVGLQTSRFRSVTLRAADLERLAAQASAFDFDGDGALLRLGIQAYTLGIAYEFDPYFALSVSRVDPLPHQLSAVYDHLLDRKSTRL